jgi:hypothetical protein
MNSIAFWPVNHKTGSAFRQRLACPSPTGEGDSMAASLDRGTRIVLTLLLLFGAFTVFSTSRQLQADEEIIAETDARTEYLYGRVVGLEKRIEALESR